MALSGGVDSSVCVQILKDQGFLVEAVVIEFSPSHKKAVEQAQKIANQLEIKLHVEKCYDKFEQYVIEPFCNAYCSGETPNPCVMCNPNVKFKTLIEAADRLGIHYIATGHYARIEEDENGISHVRKAFSEARDQSYMLYRLPQEILRRLILPVGEFEKPDIREIAAEHSLASADTPDSQEICFIPDGNYPQYIESRGLSAKSGCFISPEGKNLGAHKGVLHYTVGQRRGLNIALGKPCFVKRILENGDIQLAYSGDEFYSAVKISDIVCAVNGGFNAGEEYTIKIRSAAKCVPCKIVNSANNEITVEFEQPVRAPAPGQSAVLYKGELVYGGGYITEIIE